MFCGKCGKNIPDDATKCKYCSSVVEKKVYCAGFGDILSYEGAEDVIKTKTEERVEEVVMNKKKGNVFISIVCIVLSLIAIAGTAINGLTMLWMKADVENMIKDYHEAPMVDEAVDEEKLEEVIESLEGEQGGNTVVTPDGADIGEPLEGADSEQTPDGDNSLV